VKYPIDDPIPAQASLSCLALSLAAVASSMRVFGDEKIEFLRESGVGVSTGAYYIGKSISHLFIIIGAPAVFLFSFISLAVVSGSWIQHYLLYFLCYFCSAGVAYAVSVIVKPNLSQLVGVLVILAGMMYSGGSPTLVQLYNNPVLPRILYYPTYVSFLRWTQELYYLIEIVSYQGGVESMKSIYYYYPEDFSFCWIWIISIALIYRSIAFIVLLRKSK